MIASIRGLWGESYPIALVLLTIDIAVLISAAVYRYLPNLWLGIMGFSLLVMMGLVEKKRIDIGRAFLVVIVFNILTLIVLRILFI